MNTRIAHVASAASLTTTQRNIAQSDLCPELPSAHRYALAMPRCLRLSSAPCDLAKQAAASERSADNAGFQQAAVKLTGGRAFCVGVVLADDRLFVSLFRLRSSTATRSGVPLTQAAPRSICDGWRGALRDSCESRMTEARQSGDAFSRFNRKEM
jgi:hypothetical protein